MLLASALAILLTWTVVAIVLIGVGSLVLQRFASGYSLREAFWMGLAASVALLEIWNLLWPVNATMAILLCIVGAVGLLENRTALFHRIKTAFLSARWLISLYAVMVLFLALRASGPCDYFDTGLYGWQAVRWMQTYRLVPGLANVHGRLGFNSSVLLSIAALNQGMWRGLGFHLFTAFIIGAIGFTLLPACGRLIRGSSTSAADWFYCILTIPMASWAARAPIVGTETDQPATIVCLVAVGMLFEEFCRQGPGGDQKPGYARLVVASSLFTLAVTFKETTILFALLAWCLAFGRIWTAAPSSANRKLCLAGALVLSVILVLPWLARGILLSGYPFFPSAALGFPVDWKTPFAVTKWYGEGALSWARMPDVELADTRHFAWLLPWLNQAFRNRSASQVPALIGLGGLATVAALWLRKKASLFYPWIWLLVPSVIAVIFWFIAFPGLRFGQPAIWTTAGTLGTWGIVLVVSGPRRAQITKAALTGVLVLLIWCLIGFGWKEPYRRLLVAPPLGPLPEVSVTAHQTLSGLTVFVPSHGDQCWDAPLPCTPYFDETLRIRNPRSMRFGFTSDSQGTQLPRFQVRLFAPRPHPALSAILSPCPLPKSKSRASAITGTPVPATSATPPPPSARGNTSTRWRLGNTSSNITSPDSPNSSAGAAKKFSKSAAALARTPSTSLARALR